MDLDLIFFSVFCEVLYLGILFEGSFCLGPEYWQTLGAISFSLLFSVSLLIFFFHFFSSLVVGGMQ